MVSVGFFFFFNWPFIWSKINENKNYIFQFNLKYFTGMIVFTHNIAKALYIKQVVTFSSDNSNNNSKSKQKGAK